MSKVIGGYGTLILSDTSGNFTPPNAGLVIAPSVTSAQRTAISSPADGYEVYDTDLKQIFQRINGAWKPVINAETAGGFYAPQLSQTQRDALTGLVDGLVIFNTTKAALQVFFSSVWQNIGTPAGTIINFSGGTVPPGWLACDGSAVSRSTFADLFTALSSVWGAGNGSTTFNIPDTRGKTLIGDGQGTYSGATLRALAGFIGEEAHSLTSGELPGHTHGYSGSTGTDSPDHAHAQLLSGGGGGSTGYGQIGGQALGYNQPGIGAWTTAGANARHAHGFSGTTDTGSVGGSSHNVMQPSLVVKHIVRY